MSNLCIREADFNEFLKYREIIPTKAKVSPQLLLNENDCQTFGEIRQVFRGCYDKIFDIIYEKVSQQPEIMELIPKNETKEQLKKKVMAYCALKTRDEQEARTTEAELARKILGVEGTLNIDIFSIYYDLLSKSLSN